ncbi:AAA family ATPase [Kutzneria sp. CA-103260]|uniref:AAA family ATPase n=1 Tax=Kutzneria sp. CA-103260 TaxID=2802641 RepID=UPI001BA49B25|nr:MoxR family ATPase [Kutzneria sp. CA-103260]QUQ64296.1 Lon protease [Kutzneria sp. CA-103260]
MFDRPLFAPATTDVDLTNVTGNPQVDRPVYRFSERRAVNAVNVAMAVGRPLLVTGPPGSGKSSLARGVAAELGWVYLEHVFTSRTELADLTCGADLVRRLADAQVQRLGPDWAYLRPGVLWWAFDAESAVRRGHGGGIDPGVGLSDPRQGVSGDVHHTVVLLDEIDKADPDLPNDLLEPLDQRAFTAFGDVRVTARNEVLVVITSNGERRLPPAFVRRCVHLHLAPDSTEFFVSVARAHFGVRSDALYEEVAAVFHRLRRAATRLGRRVPSTAEYVDTVRACLRLGVRPGEPAWLSIMEAALWKDPQLPEEASHDLLG